MKKTEETEDTMPLKKLRILVVDDEPIVRLDLKAMLKVQGYDVIGEAGDGLTAVDFCRENHPDVVLMDVKMPVFDGLTAAETIIKESLGDCVILLTAFSDIDIIDKARQCGVTGYLVKPIDGKSLKPTIEVAYAQSQRLSSSQNEVREANRKLEDQKMIRRAQGYLAKEQNISETDAYKLLQKLSMDHNRTIPETAAILVKRAEMNDVVRQAKKLLMKQKGFGEEEAYRFIKAAAAKESVSLEKAASRLLGHSD